jgi:hypothetical protein
MRTVFAVASVATLASVASAQITGYGRFPCTTLVAGIPTPGALLALLKSDSAFRHIPTDSIPPRLLLTRATDQALCTGLVAPGSGTGGGAQGDGPAPVGATCSLEVETGNYFCGIAGAPCTDSTQCDNGYCSSPDGVTPGTWYAANPVLLEVLSS